VRDDAADADTPPTLRAQQQICAARARAGANTREMKRGEAVLELSLLAPRYSGKY